LNEGTLMARAEAEQFEKVLNARQVVALAFGAMVGWSWVLVAGSWVSTAGSLGTLIAFVIGGVAISLVGLTYSELASAMPKAGGEHVYTHRALGPSWSFACTWTLLFAYLNVCLFESVALPTAIEYLEPGIRLGNLWHVLGADVDLGFVLIGSGGALLITLINMLGIRFAATAQVIVTVIIIVSGVGLMLGTAVNGDWQNAQPLIAEPVSGILVVLIMVPAMLVGFDVIPQSAEEINLPPAQIGSLLVFSVFCAVLWYVLISFAVAFAMGPADLQSSSMPTADAASKMWNHPLAGKILVIGGIGGILTSWNAFIIGASRVMYALAKSGDIPAVFGKLHGRYNTPYVAILTIGALSMISPLFGRTILEWLINTGSFSALVAFLFVAVSFLVLHKNEPDMPRPFRVIYPRLVGSSAVILVVGLLAAFFPPSSSALIWPQEWATLLGWLALGAVLFFFHKARH
jgi:APA family basic amino acid/polyamine antiporter